MELIAVFFSIVAGLGLFGLAANRWGTDSREPLPDDHRR
jgi:hypothetical protein